MTKLMPYTLMLSMLLLLFLLAAALPATAATGPRISFSEESWDLGTQPQDTYVYHVLIISNTGDADLQLIDVNPPCGCTIVDRGQYPLVLKPGQGHTMNVSFGTDGFNGNVTKTILVQSNDTARGEVTLFFSANVVPSTGPTTFTITTSTVTTYATPTGSSTHTPSSPVSTVGALAALAAAALLLTAASRRR